MQKISDTMCVFPCDRLQGEICIQGSKNSVLPIMAAAVINKGVTIINNCPEIADVYTMADLLRECGCDVIFSNHVMVIAAEDAYNGEIKSNSCEKMRASILLMGGCLGRFGIYSMPSPGGCVIGSRPVNFHIEAMNKMGAAVTEKDGIISGYVNPVLPGDVHLCATVIDLPFPSVGTTQNVIIAACLAKGQTQIKGASMEPEIWDLCSYLRLFGVEIKGEKMGHIFIDPSKANLKKDVFFDIPADRIATGTILSAVAGTSGNVRVTNIEGDRVGAVAGLLGARYEKGKPGITIISDKRPKLDKVISTGPFPEFPTDMQSVFLSLMAVCGGFGIIEENIFETRFQTAYQLNRLGADIRIEGRYAYVYGKNSLHGGSVAATDLRGGAALVLAGLFADAPVTVEKCQHIYRGYENLAGDLISLGARIEYRQQIR